MKILITGGAGFIGSHLSEELLNRGNDVYIIDDLSTGRIGNIAHLKKNKRFHYIFGSIMNFPALSKLVARCDIIFHLAAAVGVKLIVDSPVRTLETNVRGTELVLAAAGKRGKMVVLTSTSEIYGKSNKVPFKENGDMVLGQTKRSRWSYACSKAIDEFLALAYYKEKGLPIIITRLFNTIGERQTGRYGMVVPRFVRQALENKLLTVYGNGRQTRSFIYVKDTVRALTNLSKEKKAVGDIFNVGGVEEISMVNLAKKVIKLSCSESKIEFIPYEKVYNEGFEDMARRVPDVSKIKKMTGFTPRAKLDDVLKTIIDYMRRNKDLW